VAKGRSSIANDHILKLKSFFSSNVQSIALVHGALRLSKQLSHAPQVGSMITWYGITKYSSYAPGFESENA